MLKRVCSTPGCPTVVTSGYCTPCARARDRARGTSTARGYGYRHQRLRGRLQARMDAGETFECWRCRRPIDPANWTLGHCDNDRTKYHGPECPPCDYATSGRTGCPHHSHGGGGPYPSHPRPDRNREGGPSQFADLSFPGELRDVGGTRTA